MREQIEALRLRTALQLASPLQVLRISGVDAFAATDALCPVELTLQDAQLKPTVLLDDEGRVFADATVARDDEGFLLLTEGPCAKDTLAWAQRHLPQGLEVRLESLEGTHRVLSLHGPWAWELLGEVLGPDIAGMPYLSMLRHPDAVVFRSGKTGEYGYDLLVSAENGAALEKSLRAAGEPFGLAVVGEATVDQCSLENGFFNARREGRLGLNPFELGLQWRLSRRKSFVGSAALEPLRARVERRLLILLGEAAAAEGAPVLHGGEPIGSVICAGDCSTLRQVVTLALVSSPWAWPGLSGFEVGGAPASSVCAPVINNRSLYVSPQKHSWKQRGAQVFPELSR